MTPGRRLLAVATIFLGVALLYYASNPRLADNYKHHVYVADAWLDGRFDVRGYPGHYHDWITVDGAKHSPFAPTPAILLLPFVWVWGTGFNMNAFSMGVAGLNAALCWLLLGRVGVGPRRAALGTMIFAFGTVNWYSAIIGTTWFLAHLCCELFLLAALVETFGRRRAVLVGLFAGMAMLSRLNLVSGLPGLALLLIHRRAVATGLRRFVDLRAFGTATLFGLGVAVPLGLELWLNWARFGDPLDTGYGTSAELYRHMMTYGTMYDWRYVTRHLYIGIFKGWEYIEEAPFLKPSPEGLSVLFTSPVLLYAFVAPWRDPTVRLLWLATACTGVLILPYFSQGWVQVGYRYVLDALPFVIVLVAMGLAEGRRAAVLLLAELSALSNALGVYWGIKLGW